VLCRDDDGFVVNEKGEAMGSKMEKMDQKERGKIFFFARELMRSV
jgi:hypothetical protein